MLNAIIFVLIGGFAAAGLFLPVAALITLSALTAVGVVLLRLRKPGLDPQGAFGLGTAKPFFVGLVVIANLVGWAAHLVLRLVQG